jgi:Glycosyltransferase family 87
MQAISAHARTRSAPKSDRPRPAHDGLHLAIVNAAWVLFLGVLPLMMVARIFLTRDGFFGFDFHVFWQAGRDFVHGASPYPVQAADVIASKENFLYPAWVAAALAPLGVLPYSVAVGLFSAVLVASTAGALYILGIRDWRCYGAVFVSLPTYSSLNMGTLSPLLMLGLAALWRFRDDRRIAVPVLAALVASKLFLWPLLVFFVATRRTKTAAYACGAALGASILAWARFGFGGFAEYGSLLRLVARVEEQDSYSVTSLGLALGVPRPIAQVGSAVLGAAALAVSVALARRAGSERDALVVVLAAALLFSPIVWGHYLMLLFVPLALTHPRFSPLWLAIAWMPPDNRHSTVVLVLGLLATAIVIAGCLRSQREPTPVVRVAPTGA